MTTLYSPDEGLFFASQDADEPFYQMSWKDRSVAQPPPIDRTFYSGWNALTAQALLHAANVLGNPHWQQAGSSVLEKLWKESWSSAQGLKRRVGESSDAAPILTDQVDFLRAWLTLYQATGSAGQPGAGGGGCRGRRAAVRRAQTAAATTPRRRSPSRPVSFPGSCRFGTTPAGPRR